MALPAAVQAEDLMQVYRDAQRYDAVYAAARQTLAAGRERLPQGAAELGAKAAQMDAVLDRTVSSVRRISAELRPLMLDDLGLHDAVAWLTDEFTKHAGIACSLSAPPEPVPPPSPVQVNMSDNTYGTVSFTAQ